MKLSYNDLDLPLEYEYIKMKKKKTTQVISLKK